jgi:hypothetical protein
VSIDYQFIGNPATTTSSTRQGIIVASRLSS